MLVDMLHVFVLFCFVLQEGGVGREDTRMGLASLSTDGELESSFSTQA